MSTYVCMYVLSSLWLHEPHPSILSTYLQAAAAAAGAAGVQALISRDHIKRRASIMDNFRSGASCVLVTTDFAARGLDLPQVGR